MSGMFQLLTEVRAGMALDEEIRRIRDDENLTHEGKGRLERQARELYERRKARGFSPWALPPFHK